MGNLGILEAYRTGKGRIVVRGKTDVELLDSRTKRSASIIKEIPHQTNKSALVEKIAELVENKGLEGISDIRDESDRSGIFSCKMVGVHNGQPKQIGSKGVAAGHCCGPG
ncbi:hypothetical protein Pyn_03857 [Prunus yedoensis var. nudiflora]|uniref:Topo IIA-type catalytic domain-containing protein n=1 Tax=Prunus yedoensis var. nudiflora TaxID=2094558 RepID=A0A314UPX8_PRUYE|nr:hypothetical protein Pyn_03857 [Prunus yedoensis var. nudiflora]